MALFYTNDGSYQQSLHDLGLLEILFRKGLIEEFKYQLKFARKEAVKNNDFKVLLQLIQWEYQLIFRKQDKHSTKRFQELFQEEAQYLQYLQWEKELQRANLLLTFLQKNDLRFQKVENQAQLEGLMQMKVLQKDPKQLPMNLQSLWHYIHILYYRHSKINQDLEKVYQHAQERVRLYQDSPKLSRTAKKSYKLALCGLIKACNQTQRFEETSQLIQKIHQIRHPKQKESIQDFEIICFINIRYALLAGEFNILMNLAKEIEAKWEALSEILEDGKQLYYCYNIMIAFWITNQLQEANYWLARILNFGKAEQGMGQIHAARIFRLMIYYDLGFKDLDKYIESTVKTFRKYDIWHPYHQSMSKYFLKLYKAINHKEEQQIIQELYQNLQTLQRQQKPNPLSMGEAMLWCEHKIKQQDLKVVYAATIAH